MFDIRHAGEYLIAALVLTTWLLAWPLTWRNGEGGAFLFSAKCPFSGRDGYICMGEILKGEYAARQIDRRWGGNNAVDHHYASYVP